MLPDPEVTALPNQPAQGSRSAPLAWEEGAIF